MIRLLLTASLSFMVLAAACGRGDATPNRPTAQSPSVTFTTPYEELLSLIPDTPEPPNGAT